VTKKTKLLLNYSYMPPFLGNKLKVYLFWRSLWCT